MRTNPTKKQIEKWVTALRSGDYKQAKDKLENHRGGYCCLGVACKVFIPKSKLELDGGILYGQMPKDQEGSPRWLTTVDEKFRDMFGKYPMVLNDIEDYSFDEIADCLELGFIHKVFDEKSNP